MSDKSGHKLVSSEDGSHTIFSNKFNAHYHSIYGAINESIHVFIAAGLIPTINKEIKQISIFEMGFGTGLNAFLSLLEAHRYSVNIEYHTVETDPLEDTYFTELNYPSLLGVNDEMSGLFMKMHLAEWDQAIDISRFFKLFKYHEAIENFLPTQTKFHLIYYDAFAPGCQPHLWEKEIHTQLYNSLLPGGVLVTYCAKGSFKRTLKELGYTVEVLDGPGRKREMTRGIKNYELIG